MLQAWLPRVREGDFVAYVLEQCAHCSRSLGRVGLDIAALARGPFREAVLRILDEGLEAAEGHWRETIANHRWSTPHASAAAIANLQGGGGAAEAAGGAAGPPLALLQHPPVAVLTNHVLTVFNELRTCAPYELRGSFFERVRVRLLACVKILDALQQQPSLGGGAGASTSHAKEHYASSMQMHGGGDGAACRELPRSANTVLGGAAGGAAADRHERSAGEGRGGRGFG